MPIIFIVSQPKRSDDRIGWSHQKNGQGKIDPETIGLPPGCFIFIPIGVHDYLNMLYTHRYMYLYIHIPVKVESTTRNFLGISPKHNPLFQVTVASLGPSESVKGSPAFLQGMTYTHMSMDTVWLCSWACNFDKISSKSQNSHHRLNQQFKPPKPPTSLWLRIQ